MSGTPAPPAGSSPGSPEPTPAPESPAPKPVVRRSTGRRNLAIIAVVVIVIIVAATLAVGVQQKWFSSGTTTSTSCAKGVTLQGDGAQFVSPLMDAWVYDFAGQTGAQVNYPASGSGTAITHFSENPPLIDFAVADEPLNASERAAMPSQPLTLPIVGGALTIIYNIGNVPGHLNLTGAILTDIYDGTISSWNNSAIAAINPGVTLPNLGITTVWRDDPAGTTFVLTDFLSASSTYWNDNVGKGLTVNYGQFHHNTTQTAEKGNSLMLSTVATVPGAIGYTDLTDTVTYKTPLSYAAIENPSHNFIVPDVANTLSAIDNTVAANPSAYPSSTGNWYNVTMINAPGASDYPLATLVYTYVYQSANELTPAAGATAPTVQKAELLVYWLNWILTDGQKLTNETTPTPLYYAALPSALIAIDDAGIKTMTFNGAAIPSCT